MKIIVTEEAGDGELVWLGLRTSSGFVINRLRFDLKERKDRRKLILARKFFAVVAASPEMKDAVITRLKLKSEVADNPENIVRLFAHVSAMRGLYEKAMEKL
jgi:hypothetical protein